METLSNTSTVCNEGKMGALYSQADLDACFHDMEHLLAEQRPVPFKWDGLCVGCGGSNFVYNGSSSGHPGSSVCNDCGVIENGNSYWETMYGRTIPTKSSNYKRVHHWHERISQLLLLESEIPNDKMLQIGEELCSGKYKAVNKDTVRAVLRSLNMQLYIEKWLQVINRLTGISPPAPGPRMIQQLDALFQDLQRPFDAHRSAERKNFLNYNYVFCRLFQKMNCSQFCMFFPLIKSKQKLKALDETWFKMTESVGWPSTPLQHVEPFSVQLEQPDLLLQSLRSRCAETIPAAIDIVPSRMAFRKWGRHPEENRKLSQELLHSDPLVPAFRRLGLLKRRRKYT